MTGTPDSAFPVREPARDLYHVLDLLLRDLWLILLALAAGLGGGWLATKLQVPYYEARAVFSPVSRSALDSAAALLGLAELPADRDPGHWEWTAAYYGSLYRSRVAGPEAMAALAQSRWEGGMFGEAADAGVGNPAGSVAPHGLVAWAGDDRQTGLVTLRLRAEDPAMAAAAARFLLDRLARQLADEQRGKIQRLLDTTRARLEKVRQQLAELNSRAGDSQPADGGTILQESLAKEGALLRLSRDVEDLELLGAIEPDMIEILEAPAAPTTPAGPKTVRHLAVGAAFGLCAGLLLVFVRAGMADLAASEPDRFHALRARILAWGWILPPLFLLLPPRRWLTPQTRSSSRRAGKAGAR